MILVGRHRNCVETFQQILLYRRGAKKNMSLLPEKTIVCMDSEVAKGRTLDPTTLDESLRTNTITFALLSIRRMAKLITCFTASSEDLLYIQRVTAADSSNIGIALFGVRVQIALRV